MTPDGADTSDPGPVSSTASDLSRAIHDWRPKKSLLEYKQGDDVMDYFHSWPEYRPTYNVHFPEGKDLSLEWHQKSTQALFGQVRALSDHLTKRREYILELARMKHDLVQLKHLRPVLQFAQAPTVDRRSAPTSAQPSPKSRMQGVDVSQLPAGFGKRKSLKSANPNDKRVRTPTEGTDSALATPVDPN